MMKFLLAIGLALGVAVALAVTKPAQSASTIGYWEKGPWGVCTDAPKAFHIADLYTSAGEQVSSDVFKQYIASGDCFVILDPNIEMFIQAVVHRRGAARVVRIADREGNLWYWLTTLPITGEPMPLDKDV